MCLFLSVAGIPTGYRPELCSMAWYPTFSLFGKSASTLAVQPSPTPFTSTSIPITVAVPGANQGAGFEALRQLAFDSRVRKVVLISVLTCRSEAKAKAAIDALTTATGKLPEFFDLVLLDLDDQASALVAVGALPAEVDVLVLHGPGGIATSIYGTTIRRSPWGA